MKRPSPRSALQVLLCLLVSHLYAHAYHDSTTVDPASRETVAVEGLRRSFHEIANPHALFAISDHNEES